MAWEPERQYDLLFAAFWLSHVPPEFVEAFPDKIRRAVRPSGTVYILDQCNDILHDMRRIAWEGVVQKRRVRGWVREIRLFWAERAGESFFSIVGQRRA